MALQFNLLPDVKLEFDRAQHAKKVIYNLSFLAIILFGALFVVSYVSVNVLQAKLLDSANSDITKYSNQLKSIPDLEKVLTIQSQLNSLPTLQQNKHISSRVFTYLPQITPSGVFIGKLNVDMVGNTIEITGTANNIELVNTFVDTMKYTSFTIGDDQSTKKIAFSNVLLSKIDRNEKQANYTIDASFDPALFSSSQNAKLVIPQETTTRSVLNTPDSGILFNGQTGTTKTDTTKTGAQ